MRFLRLVPTNLRRHRIRALIGVAGIAFGVAAMLTILAIVTGAIGMFERILATDSHFLVFERNVSDLFFSSVSTEQVAAVRALPQVDTAHPLLFGIVSSPGHPIITCFGVEPDDPRLAKAEWRSGSRAEFGAKPGEIFLGSRAAEFLGAQAGEEIEIGRAHFRVGGIFKTENGFEDGGVFLPLAAAQEFFHREGLSSVVAVKLRHRDQGGAFKAAVEAKYPGLIALENREFNQSYTQFRILHFTAWAVGICAFLLGGLGVANTMLLSVFSRIREIAILRVCGFSSRQVAALIFTEAASIAAAGLAIGFLIGLVVLVSLQNVPQFHGYIQVTIQPGIVVGIIGTALLTAIAGAVYPAQYASRIQPAEALRYE
ncbi:ABC transporter permease [Opitutaceae bacterium EW11]|nr:ABC transporter permease [Opitutaceae bacterium EW11]